MRILFFVAFLLVLSTYTRLAAGTPMHAAANGMVTAQAPTLSKAEVLRLAEQKAKLVGMQLSLFKVLTITFQPKGQPGIWQVLYATKVVEPDGCFYILVNDKTRTALYKPCV